MTHPLIMGILNVTPDSFSDGGLYTDIKAAQARAMQMVAEGADIIDVGGESTRPGAETIAAELELQRILPVISAIREQSPIPISVDTRKAPVAFEAMKAGANWINDISAATADPEMAAVMVETQAAVVIMHMRGEPSQMQQQTTYQDVSQEVRSYLMERAAALTAQGVRQLTIDPGLGFAKTAGQNLTLLRDLKQLTSGPYPVLIGASRKSFIQKILSADSSNVLEGSLGIAAYSILNGVAALRVHEIGPTVRLRETLLAIETAKLCP